MKEMKKGWRKKGMKDLFKLYLKCTFTHNVKEVLSHAQYKWLQSKTERKTYFTRFFLISQMHGGVMSNSIKARLRISNTQTLSR